MAPSPQSEDGDDIVRDGGTGPIPHGAPTPSPFHPSGGGDGESNPRAVTLALLRKRSEHNSGLVSTLEELALHQEELQSIGPVLGRTCGKTLTILLLQNNVIGRMDPGELKLFRSLEYLNLALNNVRKIEGVAGMEWLRKLDLTLNFVDVDDLEESVDELAGCRSLEELFLLGNPCMGLDGGDVPGVGGADSGVGENETPSSSSQKQIGWKGCRAYVVARLPSLRSLDGKEIKRSERIVAMQRLPKLTSELRSLAEERKRQRRLEIRTQQQNFEETVDESYVSEEAATHHDPETRTKLSNELHDQKMAKERQETANQPKPRGEKEWEEEHRDAVRRAREREERGREWQNGNHAETRSSREDGVKKDGGIKQCNQGKYQFWFEEESVKDGIGRSTAALVMRVAIPKHLSTSLVDVDVHPTYVSVVIKSKILRVILPAEVRSDRSSARRSAASGQLEVVMPKADPDEVVVVLGHVRDNVRGRDGGRATKELGRDCNPDIESETKENGLRKKREKLGQSIMKEAGGVSSLKIVPTPGLDDNHHALDDADDDDEDGPPPLR